MRAALVVWLLGGCLACGEEVALFNGKNLEGWTTWLRGSGREDPRGVFSISGGELRISGEGFGYLATVGEWSSFRLEVEWRWGDGEGEASRSGKARDSGIFVYGTGPDGNSHDGEGAYMAGVEVNLFEGATGDVLLIRGDSEGGRLIAPRVEFASSAERDGDGFRWWRPGGEVRRLERWGRVNWRWKSDGWRDVRGFRGDRDVEKPAGGWNVTRLECVGGAIGVRVNGVLVNRVERVWPAKGKILLQCEGSEILFRKVVLVPLENG